MPDALYFEDFPLGEVVEYGRVDVSVDEILAFAREFDPQPFHTNEEAARAATGGLIASGWHTSALLLRMNCEAFLARAAIVEEAGVEEVRWQLPVRPGERLHVRRQTLACRPPREPDERERGRVSLRSRQSGRRGRHDSAQRAPAQAASTATHELAGFHVLRGHPHRSVDRPWPN